MSTPERITPKGFTPRNDRIQATLDADPELAAEVEALRDEQVAIDRAYKMQLAALRQAAHLTQEDLAERLGVNQSAVSKMERRDDMLISTLAAYLRATGADEFGFYTTIDGRRIDIDLSAVE